jgi:Fe-S-cluster containining protein
MGKDKKQIKVMKGFHDFPDELTIAKLNLEKFGNTQHGEMLRDAYKNILKQIKMVPLQIQILEFIKCDRCGKCCRDEDPMLSPYEVRTLSEHFELTVDDFYQKYCQSVHVKINQNHAESIDCDLPYLKSPCPFLKKGEHRGSECNCKIYENRLIVCKTYPFNNGKLYLRCPLAMRIFDIMQNNGLLSPLVQRSDVNVDLEMLTKLLEILKR